MYTTLLVEYPCRTARGVAPSKDQLGWDEPLIMGVPNIVGCCDGIDLGDIVSENLAGTDVPGIVINSSHFLSNSLALKPLGGNEFEMCGEKFIRVYFITLSKLPNFGTPRNQAIGRFNLLLTNR